MTGTPPRTGLEFFRKIASGDVPHAPMLQLLGFRLLEANEGHVVFAATPGEPHYNGMGVTHGGFAAALLDSALGCAVNTTVRSGATFTTLEIKVNFTRPLGSHVGPVRCEGRAIHVGARTATAEGRIVDAAGKLYAHGTATLIRVEGVTPGIGGRR
jgi:uncharacterized protein (TIGR00369 family)